MAMPDIYDIAERQAEALRKRERAAASQMVRAYGEAWTRIRAELDALTAKMQEARNQSTKRRGETVSEAWLFQYRRLEAFQAQVAGEVGRFARYAEGVIAGEQLEAAWAGAEKVATASASASGPRERCAIKGHAIGPAGC